MAEQTFVIVGASLAGAMAAGTLREEGFDGRIVLLGAEPDIPYHRPALSKSYLSGKAELDSTHVYPADFYDEHKIELQTSTVVERVEPDSNEVVLKNGDRIKYDKLLLTTGSEPKKLPVKGADLKEVHYLRTAENSTALRERLKPGIKLAVIGSSWIGSEVAATARQRGASVALLDQKSVPLELVLGKQIGSYYDRLHKQNGVEMFFDVQVEALEGSDVVERVRLKDGRTIDCDLVLIGIGVAPRLELAKAAGLELDSGVIVDQYLRSSVDNIFAAGDIADAQNTFLNKRIRIEHWANARAQGTLVAKNMLDKNVANDEVPYFFSEQYGIMMQYLGNTGGSKDIVIRGSLEDDHFMAFWMDGQRIVVAMQVNIPDVKEQLHQLVRDRVEVDRDRLADTSVSLEDLG